MLSSRRGWKERVQDILDAIVEIEEFVRGLDTESFPDDRRTVRAVELEIIIIGEAAAAIPDEVQEAHPEIPWHLMRGMRNRLVHAYFAVDEQLLWETVHEHLPPLKDTLTILLTAPE